MLKFKSPNFNERCLPISIIIIHFSKMSYENLITTFMDPKKKLSSHYVLKEDGVFVQLVEEDKRAWHAGVSYWNGNTDVNSASIGIELINNGIDPYTDAQIDQLIILVKDIISRYNLKKENVLGHSDVAIGRKIDPGKHFPWKKLVENDIAVSFNDIFRYNEKPDLIKTTFKYDSYNFFSMCEKYGYNISNKGELLKTLELRFVDKKIIFDKNKNEIILICKAHIS